MAVRNLVNADDIMRLPRHPMIWLRPGQWRWQGQGQGQGVEPWIPAGGVEFPWMVTPASLLHSLPGWCLSILIAGHVFMALVHRFVWRDEPVDGMTARPGKGGACDQLAPEFRTGGSTSKQRRR